MTGKKKGVFAFMKQRQPSLYLSGCVCHLIHIAAEKAASCLPFKIDEVLVDMFYYLDKSSTRQAMLREKQEFYDVEHKKVLKHVCTRWLSVSRCLPRMLENWVAFHEFLKTQKSAAPKDSSVQESRKPTQRKEGKSSHTATSSLPQDGHSKKDKPKKDEKQEKETKKSAPASSYQSDRLERLKKIFQSPTCHLFCLFLQHTLPVFDAVNTELQSEEPKIHKLRRVLHQLLRNLFVRFLKPSATHNKLVLDVEFELPYNRKSNSEILIGDGARKFLTSAEENHLREHRIEEFFLAVKSFFVTACTYLKQKLPLDDELLVHAQVVDIDLQLSTSSMSLEYFMKRFPCLMPPGVSSEQILMEFATYQSTDVSSAKKDRLDHTWKEISAMKDGNGNLMFQNLPIFMLGILTIPHSSAHCERVFSCVRKNRTDTRSNLSNDTLEALLVVKSEPGEPWERSFTDKMLSQLKSAYSQSLKE